MIPIKKTAIILLHIEVLKVFNLLIPGIFEVLFIIMMIFHIY